VIQNTFEVEKKKKKGGMSEQDEGTGDDSQRLQALILVFLFVVSAFEGTGRSDAAGRRKGRRRL